MLVMMEKLRGPNDSLEWYLACMIASRMSGGIKSWWIMSLNT